MRHQIDGDLIFDDGNYQSVRFYKCRIHGVLNIIGGTFNNLVKFEGGSIMNLTIEGSPKFDEGLAFIPTRKLGSDLFKYMKNDFKNHDLESAFNIPVFHEVILNHGINNLIFERARIFNFKIGDKMDGDNQLSIIGCDLRKIKFQNFANYGNIKIRNSYPYLKDDSSYFQVIDSDLGEFRLESQLMSKFKEVKFFMSYTDKLNTNSVKWPKKVTSEGDDNLLSAYRQLKLLAKRGGDKPNEIRFGALEKRIHLKTLQWKKGSDIKDIFILGIGWISNNFGQYWVAPILWLLVINVLLYWGAYSNSEFECNKNIITNYFGFLNPTHKTDDIFGAQYGAATAAFDFLGRVISTYFYFQIVSGFRKFSKK